MYSVHYTVYSVQYTRTHTHQLRSNALVIKARILHGGIAMVMVDVYQLCGEEVW